MESGDSYTGGSGVFDSMLKKLLQCATLNDHGSIPRVFKRGGDIKEHLRKVKDYVDAIGLDIPSSCAFLVNTFEDSIQYELYSYVDYSTNSKNFSWLSSKLMDLLSDKVSTAGPLMQLLKIKQQPDQKVRDFEREIRVQAIRIMGINSDPSTREQFMITAFINGLSNRRAAIALKELQPKTLEDCFNMVKKEVDASLPETVCGITGINNDAVMQGLLNQIKQLQSQVSYLLSLNGSRTRPSYAEAAKGKSFTPRQMPEFSPQQHQQQQHSPPWKKPHAVIPPQTNRQCYNCQRFGHIARFCQNAAVCGRCKRTGHNSRFCPNNISKHVRGFYEETHNSDNQSCSASVTPEIDVSTPIRQEDFIDSSVCTVSSSPNKYVNKSHSVNKPKKRSSSSNDVDDWVRYIYGRGNKPHSEPTVISSSRPELARNKPLVNALVENIPSKLFIDSGAEVNVVDFSFVNKMWKSNPNLKIEPTSSSVRCANDTRMKTLGRIRLRISLGGKVMHQMFTVVNGIFPKIIMGIRQMKQHNIAIDPKNDCIWVGDQPVPFVSSIIPVNDQENEKQLA
jgi:hypothetical protein